MYKRCLVENWLTWPCLSYRLVPVMDHSHNLWLHCCFQAFPTSHKGGSSWPGKKTGSHLILVYSHRTNLKFTLKQITWIKGPVPVNNNESKPMLNWFQHFFLCLYFYAKKILRSMIQTNLHKKRTSCPFYGNEAARLPYFQLVLLSQRKTEAFVAVLATLNPASASAIKSARTVTLRDKIWLFCARTPL